jgi:hypothetical protein
VPWWPMNWSPCFDSVEEIRPLEYGPGFGNCVDPERPEFANITSVFARVLIQSDQIRGSKLDPRDINTEFFEGRNG